MAVAGSRMLSRPILGALAGLALGAFWASLVGQHDTRLPHSPASSVAVTHASPRGWLESREEEEEPRRVLEQKGGQCPWLSQSPTGQLLSHSQSRPQPRRDPGVSGTQTVRAGGGPSETIGFIPSWRGGDRSFWKLDGLPEVTQ